MTQCPAPFENHIGVHTKPLKSRHVGRSALSKSLYLSWIIKSKVITFGHIRPTGIHRRYSSSKGNRGLLKPVFHSNPLLLHHISNYIIGCVETGFPLKRSKKVKTGHQIIVWRRRIYPWLSSDYSVGETSRSKKVKNRSKMVFFHVFCPFLTIYRKVISRFQQYLVDISQIHRSSVIYNELNQIEKKLAAMVRRKRVSLSRKKTRF